MELIGEGIKAPKMEKETITLHGRPIFERGKPKGGTNMADDGREIKEKEFKVKTNEEIIKGLYSKEFNLSDCEVTILGVKCFGTPSIKEFIRLGEKQNLDLQLDVIDLVKINKGSSELIIKLNRLFLANKQERDKLAGEKFA